MERIQQAAGTAQTEKGKTMSDLAMKYEDWLRGCVHHDGRKGNVYLPCDMVLEIADWIEAHRDVVSVVRCKDCFLYGECQASKFYGDNGYCSCGALMEGR